MEENKNVNNTADTETEIKAAEAEPVADTEAATDEVIAAAEPVAETSADGTEPAAEAADKTEPAAEEDIPKVKAEPVNNSSVSGAAAKIDSAIDGAVETVLGDDDDGSKLSIAAIILGALGIVGGSVLSFIPFCGIVTFICAILGIILGIKGRKKSVELNGQPSSVATAGLILGIIGVVFGVLGFACSVCVTAAACYGIANEVMYF